MLRGMQLSLTNLQQYLPAQQDTVQAAYLLDNSTLHKVSNCSIFTASSCACPAADAASISQVTGASSDLNTAEQANGPVAVR